MKKLSIFIVIMAVWTASLAQITRESYPAVGYKILYKQDKNPSMAWSYFNKTNNWNFLGLNGLDSVKVKSLKPEDTPWANNFPSSNYVLTYFTPTDSLYYFYNITDTALWQIGLSLYAENVYVLFSYDSPEVFLPFPFNVGDTCVSNKTASTSLYFQTVNLIHNDSVIGLAEGNLTLPNGQSVAVILLKHYVYSHIWAQGVIDEEYEKIIYEWIGNGNDRGKLYASADSNLLTHTFESVQYYDSTGVASLSSSLYKLQVYPNPAVDYVYVRGIDQPVEIKVLNLKGEILLLQKNTNKIDISDLPAGVYILRLKGKRFSLDYKIIKADK